MRDRQRTRRGSVALLATLVLAACGGDADPAADVASPNDPDAPVELQEVTFAYTAHSISFLPMYVAIELGFAEEEGIDAEMVQAGGPAVTQGVLSGDFDFSLAGGAIIDAAVSGAPVRLIAAGTEQMFFEFYMQPDIEDVSELEAVGVNVPGQVMELFTRQWLADQGVDPDGVAIIATGPGPDFVGALRAGTVDGGASTQPTTFMLEDEGFQHVAYIGDALPAVGAGVGTHERMLEQDPELVEAVHRVFARTVDYLREMPDEVLPIVAEFMNIDEDAALRVLEETMPRFVEGSHISSDVAADVIAVQAENAELSDVPDVGDVFGPTALAD